ncbi:MAG TPA: dihydropteroate synthase [Tepidisphaeraceae bacterium]|nr:dihydropteroate synthase [Tepidisphaeraceae bacterium]
MSPSDLDAWLPDASRRTLVMGVLNVTPDSFSDGGRFAARDAAVARAMEMIEEGADLIDVGGESTRPGSRPVPADEQIARVVPVIMAVAPQVVVSIDTTRAAVAEVALEAGATVVNDISAGRDDPGMFPLVARRKAVIVLMHMQGTPATMQKNPRYDNVVLEVEQFLCERMDVAVSAGLERNRILVDPGIGFGKSVEHNLTLLREQRTLCRLGRPVVIGTSRKGFIGRITEEPEPARRLFGTAASVAWSVANGAAMVRVHDVKAMVQVVRMTQAIRSGSTGDF